MTSPLEDNRILSTLAKCSKGIDHLAVAVTDLESSINWFTNVLGFTVTERRETEGSSTGMVSAVLEAGPLSVVLLQGTSAQSQVSRFIQNYGAGVQHIAIRVEQLESLSEELKTAGLEFQTTIIEGGGLRQIFSKRDPGSGLMIEFIERSESGFVEQNVNSLFNQLEEQDGF